MKKLAWVIAILAILLPVNGAADEKSDYQILSEYSNILAEATRCVPKMEFINKALSVYQWIDAKFPTPVNEAFRGTHSAAIEAGKTSSAREPKYSSCQELLTEWNKIDWPPLDASKVNQKDIDKLLDILAPWQCYEKRDKIDGRLTLLCSNNSLSALPTNKGREVGSVVIKCQDNQTSAGIFWPNFLGTQDTIIVETKVDDKPIDKTKWEMGIGGESVFRQNPIKWIKSLRGAKSLIVRLKPYNRPAQELEFDIDGIDSVIDEISEACKWKK